MLTATHCNTLQHAMPHTATPCNVMPHTETPCNAMPHTATPCNSMPHTATPCNAMQHSLMCCNTLQHTAQHRTTPATHYNTLHNTAPHLQHTTTHCKILQTTPYVLIKKKKPKILTKNPCIVWCSVCVCALQFVSVCGSVAVDTYFERSCCFIPYSSLLQ